MLRTAFWPFRSRAGDRPSASFAPSVADVAGLLCDAFFVVDGDGRVVKADVSANGGLGLDAAELAAQGLSTRVHVADRPAFLHALDQAKTNGGGEPTRLRIDVNRRAAEAEAPAFVWAEMRAKRLPGGCVAVVLIDARAAVAAENELFEANARAKQADAWRDRLLANVSHELRTPLNAILGFAEMLGDPELAPREPEKQREYAQIIHSSADHLLSVVNLILDMSRLEAGEFEIDLEAFDVAGLLDLCCDILKLRAQRAGVVLRRSRIPKPIEIIADKRACRQIMLNLVANAVKFTEKGGEAIVSAESDGDDLILRVSDTGIGIPEDHLPKVGLPFYQVKANYDRRHEGTGLGLSLVRGLVGLHGGALTLESAPDVGTCVTVRLPLDCRGIADPKSHPSPIRAVAVSPSPIAQRFPKEFTSPPTGMEKKIA